MLTELFIVTAQACQNGQCPTIKQSLIVAPTVKESLSVATTVTVINGPQVAPVVFLTTEQPRFPRLRLPRLVRASCWSGKCK